MKRLILKKYWIIIICAVVAYIVYVINGSDYAVSYDDVMENYDKPPEYYERVVIYVEPTHYEVRIKARSVVNDAYYGMNDNSEAWKIWSINYWVPNNIDFVEDPPGGHYTNAYGVLQKKYGDCDDYSILLASMYESVGLDAALVFLNTDDDPGADHMACLVYWPGDADSFLAEEEAILKRMKMISPIVPLRVKHIVAGTSYPMLGKYNSGILIFVDAIMSEARNLVGHINYKPYDVVEIIDVGK